MNLNESVLLHITEAMKQKGIVKQTQSQKIPFKTNFN